MKTKKPTSREQVRLNLVAYAQADERLTPRSKQIYAVANCKMYWVTDGEFVYSAESMARFLDPSGRLNLEGLKTTIKRGNRMLIKEGYMRVTKPGRGRGNANHYSPYCSKFHALFEEAERKRVAMSPPIPEKKGSETGQNGFLPRHPLSSLHPKKVFCNKSSCESPTLAPLNYSDPRTLEAVIRSARKEGLSLALIKASSPPSLYDVLMKKVQSAGI